MDTYLPFDPDFNLIDLTKLQPGFESRRGGGHFGGFSIMESPARYLIVSVLNDDNGRQVLAGLAEVARSIGLIWIGTLADELRRSGVANAGRANELRHVFALLQIEEFSEAQALREVFRFECRQFRKGSSPFLAVEPDYPLRYFIAGKIGANFDLNSYGSFHQRYLNILKVDDAHYKNVEGKAVSVAVVDSGIEKSGIATDFEDLQTLNNRTETDQNGHGTAMASIIRSVAPDAKVSAIRISDGYPRMWKFMLGVCSASMAHSADIINLSMGLDSVSTVCNQCGASSPGLSNNLQYFLDDIAQKSFSPNGPPLLVASTGNNGSSTDFSFPARWDFTLAVGAVNSNLARARYSNYGNTMHPAFLVMPGGDEDDQGIATEWVGGGDDSECIGTSPAAAYASGMLALYASDPDYQDPNRQNFLSAVLQKCDAAFAQYQSAEHGKGFLPYQTR
jgi:hypothetical protein